MNPKKAGRALVLSIAVLLACLLAPAQLAFATVVDQSRTNDVSTSYVIDGKAVPGVQVRIYQVATLPAGSDGDAYDLTADFSKSGVSVDAKQTSAQWAEGAAALAGYADKQGLKAAYSQTSDSQGQVSFSGLQCGLYLVVADQIKVGSDTYEFSPILCQLPSLDQNGAWSYSTTLAPKSHKVPKVTSYSVTKRWQDGDSSQRPKSVKVAILRKGKSDSDSDWKTDSVQTLDASNDWTYSWTADADGTEWKVSEQDVPSGYTAGVTKTTGKGKTTFVVTNKTNTSNPPTTSHSTSTPGSPSAGTLSKTGDVTSWSSVTLLASVGVLLLVASLLVRTKKSRS